MHILPIFTNLQKVVEQNLLFEGSDDGKRELVDLLFDNIGILVVKGPPCVIPVCYLIMNGLGASDLRDILLLVLEHFLCISLIKIAIQA